MIKQENGLFLLETNRLTYLFRIMETGHPEHLYYGAKLHIDLQKPAGWEKALLQKRANLNGCSIAYDREHPNLCMDDVRLEVSGRGTGDLREPFIELVWADGSRTVDFVYESYEILTEKPKLTTLPSSYDETGKVQTLIVTLREKYQPVRLQLRYSVFEECDVIVRNAVLYNDGAQPVQIERLMSAQIDLEGSGYCLTTFRGSWAREMQRCDIPVNGGSVTSGSATGFSSNQANPFIMLSAQGTTEDWGECIGCNLIYSGSHLECVQVSSQNKTRLLTGIHPDQFTWKLDSGESFEAPEAVLAFSNEGFGGISRSMHEFVREHIVRGVWKKKPRPVLLNSWEASYFKFNESKLLKLAKAGRDVGIELFVMDDGWFGDRNDDRRSLGDWRVNEKKLPGGIRGLAEKVNALGMDFGIWVEPEMVNEDSELYRTHPDWAVRIPGRNHSEGRNQMLLDLTRPEVQEYIVGEMSKVFSAGNIAYVKWDMNRNFSDLYSAGLTVDRQGEFLHRYMMGLYQIMGELTERFPQILFEGCASGGNRFDLGILCYMPQIWGSDNTDAICRTYIQNGYSYGYPQSVVAAHVSACPNHQTLRETPLESRFAVAAFGVLGYECNLCEMTGEELEAVREQIVLYKKWRNVFQFGQFYRTGGTLTGEQGKFGTGAWGGSMGAAGCSAGTGMQGGNLAQWMVVSGDKSRAVGMMIRETVCPNSSHMVFRTKGLEEDRIYWFKGRILKHNIHRFGDLINTVSPVHVKKDSLLHNTISRFVKMDGEEESYMASGSLLNCAGVELAQGFAGTGYGENTRLYQDFDARMYFMEADSRR